MTAKLTGEELMLFRGERCLFRDVNFALNAGEMLLLEGQNGSGKTSLMRAVAGLLEFESGEVRWNGEPTRNQRQAFHNALVWMAHRVGFKADLTLIENLDFEAALRPRADTDHEEVFRRLGLSRLKRLPLRALSAGQQRRVALARMLLSSATLWLMDEPVTNLDRDGRKLVVDLVREHLAGGGMVVMAAHQEVDIDTTVHRVVLQ